MKRKTTKDLILSAMFLAIGFILPMLTGQIPVIGKILLPMHIPVLLCGFICGWKYGGTIGFMLPLARSLLFSVPVMYPTAIAVAFEMAVYGAVSGFLYGVLPRKRSSVYLSLLTAMVVGRLVWGAAMFLCAGLSASAFGLSAFWAGAVMTAIPGIVLQILLVPAVVIFTERGPAIRV